MKFILLVSLFPEKKMERWIDVFIGSVGTDGARTRSFRLDRAVLWPIELQSQENEVHSLKILLLFSYWISFEPFAFRRVVTETRMIYYINIK